MARHGTLWPVFTLAALFALAGPAAQKKENTMNVKRITAVLLVEEIEPCVKFWEALGFAKTVEVPEGNKLGFVSLQKGASEVMYQTFTSVAKDDPNRVAVMRKGPTFLYVEVDSLDSIISALKSYEVVMAQRTTFYGAKEIGVKDPGGHIITFAEFAAAPQH